MLNTFKCISLLPAFVLWEQIFQAKEEAGCHATFFSQGSYARNFLLVGREEGRQRGEIPFNSFSSCIFLIDPLAKRLHLEGIQHWW